MLSPPVFTKGLLCAGVLAPSYLSIVCLSAHAQALPALDPPVANEASTSAASTAYGYTDTSYILGAGDRLGITFFNVPEYDGVKQVLVDGSLNLPLVGPVAVTGLTLEAATRAIEDAYLSYLRTPMVSVELLQARPMQIGVSGQVNRPGSYELSLSSESADESIEWPTVVEAVQLAGGITEKADIRNIEIRRPSNDGELQVLSLNFWNILERGDIRNDITLRHGDAIYIPRATALTPAELTTLASASFSPEFITVGVVGEVDQPGTIEIPPNAPLNQALLAAGGFDLKRANEDDVKLIRLNPDGTVSQRMIPVSWDHGINEETNPPLQPNDVIVVERSGRAGLGDSIDGIFGPLGSMLFPLSILSDIF